MHPRARHTRPRIRTMTYVYTIEHVALATMAKRITSFFTPLAPKRLCLSSERGTGERTSNAESSRAGPRTSYADSSVLLAVHMVRTDDSPTPQTSDSLSYTDSFGADSTDILPPVDTDANSETSCSKYDSTIRGKHRIGFCSVWEREWSWLQFREDEGMYCTLCTKHNAISRCKSGVWVTKPCTLLRKDKVKKHASSDMHRRSEQQEALAAIVTAGGGIEHAFEKTLSVKKKAVEGEMSIG